MIFLSIKITNQTSYSNTTGYLNRPVKYIVVHYTAGSTSKAGAARNTAVMFSKPSTYASADFIVDDETIVQFNPDIRNRYCWHCGDNKNMFSMGGKLHGKCTNANSIGIEVCSTNPNWQASDQANSKKWSFTDSVVNNAVELVKYLMQTYNIPAENVVRHYDVTGKLCPGIIGWNEDSGNAKKWEEFKARLTGTTVTANLKKTDDIVYRVRKSANIVTLTAQRHLRTKTSVTACLRRIRESLFILRLLRQRKRKPSPRLQKRSCRANGATVRTEKTALQKPGMTIRRCRRK